MVEIKEKENCCGCSACAQICPKHCISMREDNEGFLYPIADATTCVDCGLCEKVCPEHIPGDSPAAPKAYAAKAKDDIVRLSSSSGGIFTLVAEKVLDAGGVVFGCAFNDKLEAEHIFVEDKESLLKLRGSKYIQSRIGNSFSAAEAFLRDGREVLFSGTPCQIAGLKKYLRKEYEKSPDCRGDMPRGTEPDCMAKLYRREVSWSAKGFIQGQDGRVEELPFWSQ